MEEDIQVEDEQLEEHEVSEEEENDVPRPLGSFMTPQPSAVRASSVLSNQSGLSLQGPQRIRVMQPWKVRDIVVPPPSAPGVKKEDPEPKELVSEEEKSVRTFTVLHLPHYINFMLYKQVIRAKRKSAFMIPDPADSRIPGSRRMSTILQPPPTTAPSVPLFPKKPFIKSDPNPPEEEEDTEVLLERVKVKIEDLKRRQSIGLGPPPLEHQRSRSPTKQDAEALFWGSDNVTSTRIDQIGDRGNGGLVRPRPREGEDMDDDVGEEREVIRQMTPVKSRNPPGTMLPPKTPRMDGMKGLFADPKVVPPTPAMGGIKQLFNEPVEPQTPVYDGIRDIFKHTAPAVQGTPVLEGVRDLLNTPVAYREQPAEVSVQTVMIDTEAVIPGTKAADAMRRGKVADGTKQQIEEPVQFTTGTTQPLRIGRARKALKVGYSHKSSSSPAVDESPQEAVSLPRPAQTKTAVDEAVSSPSPNVLNTILISFVGS
jgi:hypothetical protein